MAAILNSEVVNASIKPFQSAGLLGERDIHKKLLDLPIPIFNAENAIHRKISELGVKARIKAQTLIRSEEFPDEAPIAKQRGLIRRHVATELEAIEMLVKGLFG